MSGGGRGVCAHAQPSTLRLARRAEALAIWCPTLQLKPGIGSLPFGPRSFRNTFVVSFAMPQLSRIKPCLLAPILRHKSAVNAQGRGAGSLSRRKAVRRKAAMKAPGHYHWLQRPILRHKAAIKAHGHYQGTRPLSGCGAAIKAQGRYHWHQLPILRHKAAIEAQGQY